MPGGHREILWTRASRDLRLGMPLETFILALIYIYIHIWFKSILVLVLHFPIGFRRTIVRIYFQRLLGAILGAGGDQDHETVHPGMLS